jgi:hypothetical protein
VSQKLVYVLWHDAAFREIGWHKAEDVDSGYHMKTESCGFLVKSDEKGIVLAVDRDVDGSFRGLTFIPKGMIKKKRVFNL